MSDLILRQVESALPPHFRLIPHLSEWQNVYGRIIFHNRNRISQRVTTPIYEHKGEWVWKMRPSSIEATDDFKLTFAMRSGDQIVTVGSERVIPWQPDRKWVRPLWAAINQYKPQLYEQDVKCDRCQAGVYTIKTSHGSVGTPCYRCEGKGYQNYNDRRRNATYDSYHPAKAR